MSSHLSYLKKKEKILIAPFLLIAFSLVQTSFIPPSFSFSLPKEPLKILFPEAPSFQTEFSFHLPPASVGSHREGTHGTDYRLDPIRDEATLIDYKRASFAVFRHRDPLAIPVKLGRVELRGGASEFIPTREIQDLGDLYILRDPRDPVFLEVMERLPEGGFGRLLRYRGWFEGEWRDLEFIYQDKENSLLILDHEAGRFFRTTFTQGRSDPFSLFPLKEEKGWAGDLKAFFPSSLKLVTSKSEILGWVLPTIHWLPSQFEALSEEKIWSKRHVRGPPGEVSLS